MATNSGGPHTLKYGVTVNHVLGVEAVMPDGRIHQFGGPVEDRLGPDLVGAIVGSEGTLCIVTKVWVRLTRDPQGCRTLLGVFDSVEDATNTISEIIGAGIIPAALEMMDQGILAAVEAAFKFGFPLDARAILLIEVDGLEAGLDEQRDRIIELCQQVQRPRSPPGQRRQAAARCSGRPASKPSARSAASAPAIARKTASCPARSSPTSSSESTKSAPPTTSASSTSSTPATATSTRSSSSTNATPTKPAACSQVSSEILDECIACGGSVTGEHGIGVEKTSFMPKIFTPDDLAAMRRLHDAFNPTSRLSPDKMLPTTAGCGLEQKHPGRRAAV